MNSQCFKHNMNNLSYLSQCRDVCKSIPAPLSKLFSPHVQHVQQQLQPGLSTLAWNSMNIGQGICSLCFPICPFYHCLKILRYPFILTLPMITDFTFIPFAVVSSSGKRNLFFSYIGPIVLTIIRLFNFCLSYDILSLF